MDVALRQPLWLAFSDLFLDTDVRLNYPHIARAIAQSPFANPELQSIFQNEVAPIVEQNLFDIAGDWAGFPDDWLFAEITRRGSAPYQLRSDVLKHFHAVVALAQHVRGLSPENLEVRLKTWRILANLYLYREPPLPPGLPPDAEAIFRQEIQPAYGPSALAYQRHNPDLYPTLAEVQLNWSAWAALRLS